MMDVSHTSSLSLSEATRLVNRLKNTNIAKFHQLCKMHLSFLLDLPGSSLADFLGDLPTTPSGGNTNSSALGTERTKIHFLHFGKKKSSKGMLLK